MSSADPDQDPADGRGQYPRAGVPRAGGAGALGHRHPDHEQARHLQQRRAQHAAQGASAAGLTFCLFWLHFPLICYANHPSNNSPLIT